MGSQKWWTNWNLSYASDVYGPLIGGHSVQIAINNTLQKWLPAYIEEANRQIGQSVLLVPQVYMYRPDYMPQPKDKHPHFLTVVDGTTGRPIRLERAIRTVYDAQVSCYVAGGPDWEETQALCYAYITCARGVLVQQGGLDGFAETTKWCGERYQELPDHAGNRVAGIALGNFEVTLGTTMNPYGGPPLPQYSPSPEDAIPSLATPAGIPTTSTYAVDIENKAP